MQAKKIRYGVIGLAKTRRHRPLNANFDSGEELFLGSCDSRGVGGIGVLVNTNFAMNIDSFELLTTRIGPSPRQRKESRGFSRTTKRRLSYETLELIRQRGVAKAAGNCQLTSEHAKRCGAEKR
ncbi:hypothetical protein ANCDUO_00497 [Ancylostoma duodenale]|uniref:Uncharacterized protein n=1 Tax=Ancylostoma duodenale TaxID=51022 RepID=A0A0C2HHP7_9BILA|nr:hypothetical protein ANCDUO_00497 [Ancylostoma duodenale]